jgi:hypothetical protein
LELSGEPSAFLDESSVFFSFELENSMVDGVCLESVAVVAPFPNTPVPGFAGAWLLLCVSVDRASFKRLPKRDDEEGFAALLTTGFGGTLKASAGCGTFNFGCATMDLLDPPLAVVIAFVESLPALAVAGLPSTSIFDRNGFAMLVDGLTLPKEKPLESIAGTCPKGEVTGRGVGLLDRTVVPFADCDGGGSYEVHWQRHCCQGSTFSGSA